MLLAVFLFFIFYSLFFVKQTLRTAQDYFANLLAVEQQAGNVENFRRKVNQFDSLASIVSKKTNSPKITRFAGFIHLLKQHLTGKHKYMLVFQNSEEIRATGGFMGSFALLELNEGRIKELNFYDIYDADGQFELQVEAPAGVKEYLSSGEGHRLPDANWHPDFPSSGQKIIKFMDESGFKNIDGVVAINLETVEKLLDIVAGVYLPDYGMTITSDNFYSVARADRETYFSGSKAKKDFLKNLFNNLKIKLSQLNSDQQKELLQSLIHELKRKNLQFYSKNPDIQKNFEQLKIAGQLATTNYQLLYLVESNVGINKANKNISREVKIDLDQGSDLKILFSNKNQNLDYINYQRLISNPESEVQNIKINNESLEAWNEEIITNSKGEKFKQIGFLAPVPANKTSTVQIQLLSSNSQLPIAIYKQPGLTPTPYTIINKKEIQSFVLEKDLIIN